MKKTYYVVLSATLLLIGLCLVMLSRVRQRLVVSIDGFDITTEQVGIGRLSEVCFDHVPHDFLTVTHDDGGFVWQVNDRYLGTDSLCYFHINGTNPNIHDLAEGQDIVVSRSGKEYVIHVGDLDTLMGDYESQYVMLRNVLERRRQACASTDADFRDMTDIRSFLFRQRSRLWGPSGHWQLVILDRMTSLEDHGSRVGYATSGHAGNFCKVQFFRMAEYSFKSDDKDIFRIGDINYMAKPVLVSTQWGAGHVMLRQAEGGVAVRYPKPLTYTEDVAILRDMSQGRSSIITLQQNDGSLPLGHTLYLPPFSTSVPQEVCHVMVSGDSLTIDGHDTGTSLRLLPSLRPLTVDTGMSRVYLHTGTIGMAFVMSYLWLPLLVFLLIFMAFPMLVRVDGMVVRGKSFWADRLPLIFRMVATIAFAYCVCKSMMAFKLSFTYPYFEKLTGVIVVCTALSLMLFFTLSLIVNYRFLGMEGALRRGHRRLWRKWLAVGVSLAGTLICLFALRYSDQHYSAAVIESYMPGEVFVANPLRWSSCNGINDLHRSVPYTLLLFNFLGVVFLIIRNLLGGLPNKPLDALRRWEDGLGVGNKKALIVAAVYGVMVAVASIIPGNFATALITLVVIVGMGHALTHLEYTGHRVKALFTSLAITAILLVAAIFMPSADKGYFTNYLGFVSLVFFLYVIVVKYSHTSPTPRELKDNETERRWMNWGMGALMVVVVFGVPTLMRHYFDADNVDYDRTPRRFMMFSQFEKYRNSGYRYAVSDTEFMTVMVHGMFNTDGGDPMSPERHALHPSVSTGQSPVVLNDVSMPVAFFGTYGLCAYLVYFGLLALLVLAVVGYTLPPPRQLERSMDVDVTMIWRLLSVMMWVGTSYYLYSSYVGLFPFTGRLNPGMGIDSVGEALESVILMAFMTATPLVGTGMRAEGRVSRL